MLHNLVMNRFAYIKIKN